MLDSKVISINPGVKTLGELHNPTQVAGFGVTSEITNTVSSVESGSLFDFFYGKHDQTRPGVATIIIRLLASSAAVWCASLFASGSMAIVMLVLAFMMMVGLGSRLIAIANMAMSSMMLISTPGTESFPMVLTIGAITILLNALVLITGPGKFSVDSLLSKTIRR